MKDTRIKILDAAERLFATKGVDAVSLRQINAAAGVSPSVLHYHFGGRDTLIAALLERRFPALKAKRTKMLENLKALDRQATLRELLEVILRPLAEMAVSKNRAEQRFLKVLARLHLERNAVYDAIALQQSTGGQIAILGDWARLHPDYPIDELEARVAMAINLMFSTLAMLDHPPPIWQQHLADRPLDLATTFELLLDFMAAGIESGLN